MEQPKLLEVPVTETQNLAERYADMAYEIRQKQEKMKCHAEQVIEAMDLIGQRKLTFVDTYGVRHTFEVVHALEKLRYTRAGESAN